MLHGLLLVKRNPAYCGAVCRTDSSREKAFSRAPQGAVMSLAVQTPHVKRRFGASRSAPFTVPTPSRENATQPDPQGTVMLLAVPTLHVKKRFGAPRRARQNAK